MDFFGKFFSSFFQNNQELDGIKDAVSNNSEVKTLDGDLENNLKIKEILDNPLEAFEKNKKLRNAVFAQQKQMGWNILPATSEYGMKDNSTDLAKIKLNHKIRISSLGNETVNILMFGKSGCGQTTLLSYLTKSNELKGADSMSTQQFYAETIDMQSKAGMTKVRFYESPGMCSGFEIPQLEEHWNRLIGTLNDQGGVSIFLLLIKSNERIISQFIDELEEFSELYFEDKEEFWKRTVVVFTTIDELNGCSTFEERVDKLESQIAKRGMEKVKRIIDQTGNKCLYVSCIDKADKQRLINDLRDRINSIYQMNGENLHNNNLNKETNENQSEIETDSNNSIPYSRCSQKSDKSQENYTNPLLNNGQNHQLPMHILEQYFECENIGSQHEFNQSNLASSNIMSFEMTELKSNYYGSDEDTSESASRRIRANTISVVSNLDFGLEFCQTDNNASDSLQQLTKDELIRLFHEMCQNKKGRKHCDKNFRKLFPNKEPPLTKGKKSKLQP